MSASKSPNAPPNNTFRRSLSKSILTNVVVLAGMVLENSNSISPVYAPPPASRPPLEFNVAKEPFSAMALLEFNTLFCETTASA